VASYGAPGRFREPTEALAACRSHAVQLRARACAKRLARAERCSLDG